MEDTEQGNMKYIRHATHLTTTTKKKETLTFGGCSNVLMRHCLI